MLRWPIAIALFAKKSESLRSTSWSSRISQVEPIAECHFILEAARAAGGLAVNGPARYLGRLRIT